MILIGSGNVASHLGEALFHSGVKVVQVYDRRIANAKALAKKFKAKATDDLSKLSRRPALFIIAVKDDAITTVAKKMTVGEGIVVHTSGSIPMDVLKKFPQHGVIYPLQTFTVGRQVDFEKMPLCIEANDTSTLLSLTNIAETISEDVYNLDSTERLTAHLAAVFANNFSNHLFYLAEKILKSKKLPFDLMRPLIEETAAKVQQFSPAEAQTGPAKRKDQAAMKRHLDLLKGNKELQEIYKMLSKSIGTAKA